MWPRFVCFFLGCSFSPEHSAFLCVQADFRDYPPLLRQAVSIARKIQDPLMEYAQVCSTDDDILCLKLHPLQVRDWRSLSNFFLPNAFITVLLYLYFKLSSEYIDNGVEYLNISKDIK